MAAQRQEQDRNLGFFISWMIAQDTRLFLYRTNQLEDDHIGGIPILSL
jgi:hypothetical protein